MNSCEPSGKIGVSPDSVLAKVTALPVRPEMIVMVAADVAVAGL